ncbi:MAG: discoidin domain-containing protein [Planctomycetaceae bacterium]
MMDRMTLATSAMLLVMSTLSRPAAAESPRGATSGGEASSAAANGSLKAKFVSASSRDAYQNPEAVLDGDPATEFTFVWGNGGAEIVLDLGGPSVVESLDITSGPTGGPFYLSGVSVGPTPETLSRDLLHRGVNLVVVPGKPTTIRCVPAVTRYLRLLFSGGGKVGVGEIAVHGRPHRPERHLCHWWSGDVKTDFLDAMDYLDRDLQATDVWIDKIASVFPGTRPNYGFEVLDQGGAFRELRKRGINYWLIDEEGFGGLVNGPDDLRDDAKLQAVLRR